MGLIFMIPHFQVSKSSKRHICKMIYFLSLLPILLLIVLSLTKGVKPAVLVGLVVTTALFFYWEATLPFFLGAMGVSLLTTINILMIVLGAAFLYNVMQETGLIKQISHSLDNLHPSRELRFFLLALCLTAFFEGVAGFGTPGAIVPLILISMGFEAVLAVSVVLLFDGLFATFGAVGTPVLIGLQLPLGLSREQVQVISLTSALLTVLAGLLILFFVFRLFLRDYGPIPYKKEVLVLYAFFAIPYVAFAYLVTELATVLGALFLLVGAIFYLRQGKGKLDLWPWLPYAVLAGLLLLPKLIEPLQRWIGWELAFPGMFGTDIRGAIKPLQSPLIPFALVGLGVILVKKSQSLHLAQSLRKTANVFMVLFPSIAIAQLMIYSGVTQPSMVQYISAMLSALGQTYVVFAPFVGIMGTFITGSTTISNIVFGASQVETAQALDIAVPTMLALQHTGAGVGNAICLFNIIAAASIANLQNYRGILANNMVPTLLAGLLVGLLGVGLVWLG
jgi:lactate permease